ncbi:Uma2 family endonuclease [Dyadobacter sp. CY351]|uniref:Uma2 family endonuclease n=1 Tax=Dyadobacter sp. CY351 TaxID=2909337 RepID=UPI001F33021F|nr:Uma2 family endonuclease [Dyadobacter sp. CY351]MCF2519279.1 Uma2 family endonuclease [Dyadobacter sp. CY351]
MDMPMPVTMKMGDLMSEEEFFQFCQMNDTLKFERDSQGNIIIQSLSGALTSIFNAKIAATLGNWNRDNRYGYLFDSSTGFTLPNKAVRSPDASFLIMEKWDALSEDEKETFAPVCPDFVVEIHSQFDDLAYLQDKMNEFINNGTQLGWLIDRFNNKIHIYRADQSIVIHDTLDVTLSGEDILPGFSLNPGALLK